MALVTSTVSVLIMLMMVVPKVMVGTPLEPTVTYTVSVSVEQVDSPLAKSRKSVEDHQANWAAYRGRPGTIELRVTEKTYSRGMAMPKGSEAKATRAPSDAQIRILAFCFSIRVAFCHQERVNGAEEFDENEKSV